MADKKNKKERIKTNTGRHGIKPKKQFWKNPQFIFSVIAAIIIVVIVVLAITNPFFSPPSKISPDKYYKISDHDLLSNGSTGIYFISWYGCPIGATDSWALYYAMNSTTDIYSHVD